LRDIRQRYPDELVVIGVHSAKFPTEAVTANIREAILRHDIRHPVVNDTGFQIWQQYAVRAWPTVVVIDPNGKIVNTQSGEIQASEYHPVLDRLIEEFEQQDLLDRAPLDLQPEISREPDRPLSYPSRLVFTREDRFYLADTGHHRIIELQLDPDGLNAQVERIFGSGEPGLQDGPAEEACFHNPHGLALLRSRLYVADTDNHAVRSIGLNTGGVHTVAGTGEKGSGYPMRGSEPLRTALRSPWGVLAIDEATEDRSPVLFIAMAGSHQVWLMVNEESLGIFAGSGREALVDGSLTEASFNQPSDLALLMNHLIVADAEASAVRAIALTGDPRVFTLVGRGLFEFGDQDGAGVDVRLQHPTGLAASEGDQDEPPTIYIADTYNHKIKSLDPTSGQVETLIGDGQSGSQDGSFESARLYQPEGLALHNGRLYIADTNNHLIRVADLQTRTVYTLKLKSLESLAGSRLQEEEDELERLEAVETAPGRASVVFDITLPAGFELNPEAPISICSDCGEEDVELKFRADETVAISFETDQDFELPLDVTVYYCQAEDMRLCLIHNRRVILPVRIKEGAPTRVTIPYKVM
jgi:sugar lactone lactonase YvrE